MRRLIFLLLTLFATALAACSPAVVTPASTEPVPTLPPSTPLPEGVMIDYTREGGFDGTSLHLVINWDGTAKLEGTNYVAPAEWTIDADKLELLKAQIGQPEFAALPLDPHPDSVCADCFVYTLNAYTAQGVKTLQFDDADISTDGTPPLYQGINGTLAAVIASAPTPNIPEKPEVALPTGTLLIFHQEGGIAFTETTLTVMEDGSATLEGSSLAAPVQWTLSEADLAAVQKSLTDPVLSNVHTDGYVMCADCYVYSLTFRGPHGVRYFQVDDADFFDKSVPEAVSEVVVLLNTVKKNAPKSI